jgi:hypothetical protein
MHKDIPRITEDAMKDAVNRSGYLLEQRVEDVLKQEQFQINYDNYFRDDVTDKIREIDVVATEDLSSQKLGHQLRNGRNSYFNYRLICECKNNYQPLVFFRQKEFKKQEFIESSQMIINDVWPYPEISTFPYDSNKFIESPYFTMNDHYYSNEVLSNQYCTFQLKATEKWEANHSEEQNNIFITLIKASLVHIEKLKEEFRNIDYEECDHKASFVFPIIVYQGDLYITSEKNNGNIELEKINHLVYLIHYKVESSERMFAIDIINESYLPELIKKIKNQANKFSQIIGGHYQLEDLRTTQIKRYDDSMNNALG